VNRRTLVLPALGTYYVKFLNLVTTTRSDSLFIEQDYVKQTTGVAHLMKNEQLQSLIATLHKELSAAETVDADSRALLQQLIQDVEDLADHGARRDYGRTWEARNLISAIFEPGVSYQRTP